MNPCDFTLIQGGRTSTFDPSLTITNGSKVDFDLIIIILIILVVMIGFQD